MRLIWLFGSSDVLAPAALQAIRAAADLAALLISPVSGWEIGLLAPASAATLCSSPRHKAGSAIFSRRPGMRLAPLVHGTAISASYLPGHLHGDPADRLLIATARELDVPLVTRDQRILAYAAQGHVQAIAC